MKQKKRTITITDVAEKADVSKSTVSQYMNHRYEYMSVKTRERISTAVDELGYQPNIVARSLKQKNSMTIGVIVANIAHEFSTQIVRSIEEYCHAFNYHIIVCNAEDNPEKEKKYIDVLRAKQVDGIITFPTSMNVDLYRELTADQYPMIFIDRHVPEVEVCSIMLDNKKAAQLAVDDFVAHGRSRIGILTTSIKNHVVPRIERIEGFIEALYDRGLMVNEQFIKGVEVNEIPKALEQMMQHTEPPDAILAGNDLSLIAILKYIKENDLHIPEDLALIGIDDVPFASVYYPTLTTISQPTTEMGRKAAELLINQIKEDDQPEEIRYSFEPKLIRRASC